MKTLNNLFVDLEKHFPMFFVENQSLTLRQIKLDHTLIDGFKFYNDKTVRVTFRINQKWSVRDGNSKRIIDVKDRFYIHLKKDGYDIDQQLTVLVQA